MRQTNKTAVYMPNNKLYLTLIVISCGLTALQFCPLINYPISTLFSSIGSGGFASGILAWLIDSANCNHKNKLIQALHTKVFEILDLRTNCSARLILSKCLKNNESIEIKANYTLEEITDILTKTTSSIPDWEEYVEYMEEAIRNIDITTFCNPDNKQNIEIYEILSDCISIFNSKSMGNHNNMVETFDSQHVILFSIFRELLKLYNVRNVDMVITLSEPEIKNLIRDRENKSSQNASNIIAPLY